MLYASEIVHETINTLRFFMIHFLNKLSFLFVISMGSWHHAACQTNAELIVNASNAENDFHFLTLKINFSFDPYG